jgi:hypothetical protein
MVDGAAPRVPLSGIRFFRDAWPREYLDPERVEDFAALYREHGPDALPAIDLLDDGRGGFLILDGVHRIEAAKAAGLEALPARVFQPPAGVDLVKFTYYEALRVSAFSAKPLTRAEKQKAIRKILAELPNASDREIARLVGVDHKTVGRLRRGAQPAVHGPGWTPGPSPAAVAKRLFQGFEKAYQARGLGISDFFTGDRTGERLAGVLRDVYGDRAAEKARLFRQWLDDAVRALKQGG